MKMKMFRFHWFSLGLEQRRNQGSMVNGIVDMILVLEGFLCNENENLLISLATIWF